MPAISCVLKTTRVASMSDCWLGSATSQSGMGYEPTTVVRMSGAVAGGTRDLLRVRKTHLNEDCTERHDDARANGQYSTRRSPGATSAGVARQKQCRGGPKPPYGIGPA